MCLIAHHLTFKEWDTSDIFADDGVVEAQGIEVMLDGRELRIINVYIPPGTSCPPGYSVNFAGLGNTQGDCLLVGDFNAHHPSWYSHTEDDRAAARGNDLDAAVTTSDLCILNEDTPTRLPSSGPPTSPDLTIISGHLALSTIWSTQTTLGSDHLPIVIELPGNSPAPRKCRSYVNFRRADWEGFKTETESSFSDLALPSSCAVGEKVFRKVLLTAAKHHIPAGYRKDFVPGISPTSRVLMEGLP